MYGDPFNQGMPSHDQDTGHDSSSDSVVSIRRPSMGDSIRQMDWHMRSQIALRDSLLADIERKDELIKHYESAKAKDEELIHERTKMVESIKARIQEREKNIEVRDHQMELIRQQNIQIEKELEEKKNKLAEKIEILQKLETNLPPVLNDMRNELKKKEQSIHELRLAFGLPPLIDQCEDGEKKLMIDDDHGDNEDSDFATDLYN